MSSCFASGISEATVSVTGFDDMGTLLVGATLYGRTLGAYAHNCVRRIRLPILPQRVLTRPAVGCSGQQRQAADREQ
ncbi:hypothetical protein GCM10010365_65760 [Streptomyces poonensis]|uniref:Uncharacterized protein n=1 Tax=Streptomyces poonensis TaxID=68255 RepID=A0A918Q763_9ACTN|nr:hypothetical protein GCM10010365_65760 [Streptomyces poonensis]GLJ89637.1 hypothetical protein GCM10017589_22370 [Streptomyces poonensis]